jgi:hypothetical protein
MNTQTRMIVCTAFALAAVDIAVRGLALRQGAPATNINGVVAAREFRLVDSNGTVKATIAVDDNGNPGMVMTDKNGTRRLQLDTYQDVPSLMLFGPAGERRSYYGMNLDGSSLVQMLDENERITSQVDLSTSLEAPRQTMYFQRGN